MKIPSAVLQLFHGLIRRKRWAEGAIYTGDLQRFKHPYMVMMFVGPNFHIKWAGRKLFSLENQFITGLFNNTLFTDEVE
jgi:hypothetical protein